MSAAEWEEDDTSLTNALVPAVLQAQCVEDKNKILCEGIYGYFASKYGTIQIKPSKVHSVQRPRKHNRAVKKITKEKNIARRELRRAIKEGKKDDIIKDIARKFHKMIRMHSRAKKEQLKSRLNLEAGKARLECARNLWRYAAKILDGEEDLNEPSFSVKDAEEFFKKVYSRPPSKFQRPQWLPPMNRPQVAFDDSAITLSELAEVIRRTKNSSSPSPMDRVGY